MAEFEEQPQYMKNRRTYIRVPYSCQLEYLPESEHSRKNKAYVVNMSARGICVYLPDRLSVGQQITIDSNVLPFPFETCRVRWTEKTIAGNYIAGLEFCLP